MGRNLAVKLEAQFSLPSENPYVFDLFFRLMHFNYVYTYFYVINYQYCICANVFIKPIFMVIGFVRICKIKVFREYPSVCYYRMAAALRKIDDFPLREIAFIPSVM